MTRPIMIFAAGFGTRMAPLTQTQPKPMITVAGKRLIDHAVHIAQSCPQIVVNTHYMADQIHNHLGGQNITLSHETHILDTGGGVKRAVPVFDATPIYTLNSDAVWVGCNPLHSLETAWRPHMQALLLLAHHTQIKGHSGTGDFDLSPEHRLIRGGPYVYLGAQIIHTGPIAAHRETMFSLNTIWDDMIAQNTAYGCLYTGQWCDVGRPENIAIAEHMVATAHV
ncbi:MAG: nucleotidyltransferase family protein [Pseudomonadota bacterium]